MASFFRARVFRACSRFRSRSRAVRSSALSWTPGGARGRARRRELGFFCGCAAGSEDRGAPDPDASLASSAVAGRLVAWRSASYQGAAPSAGGGAA